ncbi:MAG TPA: pyrroline-5-carboxylate reductase [Tepidisphaeraceae bacterium]|nr:pyrroline-5-carboxylate reductase [Tepidisphaeraceae bacterium]
MKYELAILGAGQMAEAILRGILKGGVISPERIIAADPAGPRRKLFETLGVTVTAENPVAARDAKIILLATKPYQLSDALAPLAPVIATDAVIISIAAGISTARIAEVLGRSIRVIRAMPNTPMLIGYGAVAIAPNVSATAKDIADARKIFETAALVVEVSEDDIDAVTALSGSGPAYFFYLVECMIQAGVQMGLSPDISRQLAIQTCLGSGKLLAESSDSPAELRRKVTTPNGTTHAAISHMENQGFATTIVDALEAARKRAKELGQK